MMVISHFTPTEPMAGCSPISEDAHQNLAHDDSADFEVLDRGDPRFVADFVRLPAGWEAGLEEGLQVSDGK